MKLLFIRRIDCKRRQICNSVLEVFYFRYFGAVVLLSYMVHTYLFRSLCTYLLLISCFQGFLTDSGLVNPARVQMIMQELGKAEDSIFKDRQRNELSFKARMKNKRRRERQQESNEAPAWLPRGQFAPQALGGGRGSGPGNKSRNMLCLKNETK